jgi:hypothetical protein
MKPPNTASVTEPPLEEAEAAIALTPMAAAGSQTDVTMQPPTKSTEPSQGMNHLF